MTNNLLPKSVKERFLRNFPDIPGTAALVKIDSPLPDTPRQIECEDLNEILSPAEKETFHSFTCG